MKNIILVILVTYIVNTRLYAQNPDGELSDITFGKGVITEFNELNSSVVKQALLFEEFQKAKVILKNNSEYTLIVNYELFNNLLYIESNNRTLTIPFNTVKSISTMGINQLYKNLGEISDTFGIAKVIQEGEFTLIETYTPSIKEANYNVALNVGEKKDKIVIKSSYKLIYNESLIPLSKKKIFIQALPEYYQTKASEYIKEQKVNLKQLPDIRLLVEYLNDLPQ